MVTFRNNNGRRNNFRRGDRSYKSNVERPKFNANFSSSENFQRKIPGRNNHNASKLIEKYNNLAREALSNGDKILSENYFQHADHFTRILSEQDMQRRSRISENQTSVKPDNKSNKTMSEEENSNQGDSKKKINSDTESEAS